MNTAVTTLALRSSGCSQPLQKSEAPHELFDDVARILGGDIPRRRALKLTFTGLIGAFLAEFGIRTSWAAADCVCLGKLYDPEKACCTATGVQLKNPIATLPACPNRVPHPGHIPSSNGCTKSPDGFGAADFRPGCNAHDICFDTCNTVKATCDSNLHTALTEACNAVYATGTVKSYFCLGAANRYYDVVSNVQGWYDSAQKSACDCCGTSACPQTCSGGTCGSAASCEGNCVCFLSVEGNGFCHRSQPCAGSVTCTTSSQCQAGYVCSNITCCGAQSICIRPCNVIVGLASELNYTGSTTTGFVEARSIK